MINENLIDQITFQIPQESRSKFELALKECNEVLEEIKTALILKENSKMETHTVLSPDGKLLEYTEARIGTVVGSMRIERNREKTVIDLVTANHFGIPHEIELETFNGKHKLKAILETTTPYLGVLGKDVLGSESN